MNIQEMIELFIDSRKRGTMGANKPSGPKTIQIYEWNLKIFADWLMSDGELRKHGGRHGAVMRYEDITRTSVSRFIDFLDSKVKNGEFSAATRLQVLRTLRTFFRWVDKDEDLVDDEGRKLKGFQKYLPKLGKTPIRNDVPDTADLKKLIKGFDTSRLCGFRDYVIACVLAATGIRNSELCTLRLKDLHLDERFMYVNGKTGTRPVALPPDVARLLKTWLKRRSSFKQAQNSEYVFVSKYAPKLTHWGVCEIFRKLRLKLGLPRITPHTFRHAFCTTYLKKGGNVAHLKAMTGHKTYAMLQVYVDEARVMGKELQEELGRVNLLRDING